MSRPATRNLPYLHRGDDWNGIPTQRVRLKAAASVSGTADAGTDVITAAGHDFVDDEEVCVDATAGGLTANLRYFVIAADTDAETLQLSATLGGAAVDLTAASVHAIHRLNRPAAALASVRIQFRRDSETGTLGLTLSTADETIALNDAADWEFTVPAQDGPAKAGTWYYDIETTDADGVIWTTTIGTMEVGQDVTK